MRTRLYFWMRYSIVLFHIVWPYQILTFWAFCWSILTGITITNGLRLAKIPKIITLRHNIKPFIGSIASWLQTNSTFKSSTKSTSIRISRQNSFATCIFILKTFNLFVFLHPPFQLFVDVFFPKYTTLPLALCSKFIFCVLPAFSNNILV